MTAARVGGALFLTGVVALLILAGPVAIGPGPASALLSAGAVVVFGFGAAILAVSLPRPLGGSLMGAGLALLAIAALGGAISAVAGIGYRSDPLESWAIVGPLLIGVAAGAAGGVSIAIALVRSNGPARILGLVMAVGLVSLIPGGVAFGDLGRVVSAALIVIGLLGFGILAVTLRGVDPAESPLAD